jgi:uncharacterized membrane protein
MYALHALCIIGVLLTPIHLVSAFLSGWPSLLALLLNYLKNRDMAGTWLASHLRWQRRTFWFALLWLVIGYFFLHTLVGVLIGLMVLLVAGQWAFYRIARGWIYLIKHNPMPMPAGSK